MPELEQFFKTYRFNGPRWKFWVASLLGKRVVKESDEYRMVAYRWRGDTYVVEFKQL